MLQRNKKRQFRLLMTVIDVAYEHAAWLKTAREEVRGTHSLGALKKMFYHDTCHDTINGFSGRRGMRARPHCRNWPCRDIMSSMPMVARRRQAWRAARPPAACPDSGGHADPGEPGVREAFERTGTQRDLHIEPGT